MLGSARTARTGCAAHAQRAPLLRSNAETPIRCDREVVAADRRVRVGSDQPVGVDPAAEPFDAEGAAGVVLVPLEELPAPEDELEPD